MFYSASIDATNISRYSNLELDSLIDQAVGTRDDAEIKECYAKAYAIIQDEMPIVPMFTEENMAAMAEGLKVGVMTESQLLYNSFSWD